MCQPGRPDAERRAPRRLVGQRRLPEHEVERGAPVRIVGVAAARPRELDHAVFGVVRELAEVGEGRHVEVHRAAAQYAWPESSSRPTRSMIRGTDSVARGSATGGRISSAAMSPWNRAVSGRRELEVRHAELTGLGQDRVVDVGDVAHHAHLVAELLEPADEEVVGEELAACPRCVES